MVRTSGEESSPDLKANTRPAGMSPKEEVLYNFVADLTTKHATSDAAFDLAKKLLDEQQVVDLTGVAGTYIGVAMILAMEQEGLNLLTASRGAEQWHEGK